jgi:SCY1-like protein 2
MGNQSLKNHTLERQTYSTGGPGSAWKIYPAKTKVNPEEVSLWIYDKKSVSTDKTGEGETFLEVLRRDAQSLSKLRHPFIIRVNKPVEESKTSIMMETEPIITSLSNVLNKQSAHKHTAFFGSFGRAATTPNEWHLEDQEIKVGLMNVCEAITFIHQNLNIVHLNIGPENIFIAKDGSWKLGGFNFSTVMGGDVVRVAYDFNGSQTYSIRPNLDYTAPEVAYTSVASRSSDVFALGCLIFELYNRHTPLLNANGSITVYRQKMTAMFPMKHDQVPYAMQATLEKMLAADPKTRLPLSSFVESEIFNDVATKSLVFLQHILDKDDQTKAIFFKGLTTIIGQFSPRIMEFKVIPQLLNELRNFVLAPFILPNVFTASTLLDSGNQKIFGQKILPQLAPLFAVREPYQIPLLLLQHLEFIYSRATPQQAKEVVLPMILAAFDHPTVDIQVAVLKMLPVIVNLIEYDTLKNAILPKIQASCVSVAAQAVRINALLCMSKIVNLFTKNVVEEVFVPTLIRLQTLETNGAIMMGVVGVCDAIAKKFGEQITATKLLPIIIPFTFAEQLNHKQFETIIHIIRGMLGKIEEFRGKQLEIQKKIEDENAKIDSLPDHQKFNKLSELVSNQSNAPKTPTATNNFNAANQFSDISFAAEAPSALNFENLIKRQESIKEPAPKDVGPKPVFGYDFASSSSTPNSSTQISPVMTKNTNTTNTSNNFDAFTNIFASIPQGNNNKANSTSPVVQQKTEQTMTAAQQDDFFSLNFGAAPSTQQNAVKTRDSSSPLSTNNTSNIKISFPAPVAMPKKVEPVNGGVASSDKETDSFFTNPAPKTSTNKEIDSFSSFSIAPPPSSKSPTSTNNTTKVNTAPNTSLHFDFTDAPMTQTAPSLGYMNSNPKPVQNDLSTLSFDTFSAPVNNTPAPVISATTTNNDDDFFGGFQAANNSSTTSPVMTVNTAPMNNNVSSQQWFDSFSGFDTPANNLINNANKTSTNNNANDLSMFFS